MNASEALGPVAISPVKTINVMARFGRGLIGLTLTKERCERLQLPPLVPRTVTKMGTAFTAPTEAVACPA